MNSSTGLTVSEYFDINDKLSDATSFYDISRKILSPLAQLIDAESSIFTILKKNKRGMTASNFISDSVDKKSTLNYEKHFQNADPVLPHAFHSTQLNYRSGRSKSFTFTLDNIVDPRKFSNGEYYNEFLRPNSIRQILAIGIPSSIDKSLIYVLGFHRHCDHPFRQKDTLASAYFGPALFNILNALELKSQLQDQSLIVSHLQNQISETGLVIVNKNHDIIFANQTGQKHFNIKPINIGRYSNLENSLKAELKSRLPLIGTPSSRQIEFEHGATKISARIITSDSNNQEQRIILHTRRASHHTICTLEMEKCDLTHREIEISNLIIMGLTNPEISDKLCISTRTVENHLRSIYTKVNVKNRTSLAYKLAPTQH
ncbi:MAG: helix-turn-helix transcriptional regulator [Emcibacter sp.]|nr:helix-turn-helix transcriptional regulator [Emcibacter sp.]